MRNKIGVRRNEFVLKVVTFIVTNNTPWSGVLLEKLTGSQLVM